MLPMSQTDQDHRRSHRVMFTMRAPVSTDSGGGSLIDDSTTIDISESGVRLRLRGQVLTGQIVEVFLNKHTERCRVVWTNPGATNELIAGLEFIRSLPNL
jgi:hypothetical protein